LPFVAVAFTVLGLAMVPVLVMIAATGIAFGPWLGPPYAMVACLTSASAGFGLGRWIGPRGSIRRRRARHQDHARARAQRHARRVLLRKVPAPFMLANVLPALPASVPRLRLGTLLGMGAFVVAWRVRLSDSAGHSRPESRNGARGGGVSCGPFTLAWESIASFGARKS
jgi:uncharacterized membrane protein YdjX (TVP38/TMEM64 family)